MEKKISQLSEITTIDATVFIPVVKEVGGVTDNYKITPENASKKFIVAPILTKKNDVNTFNDLTTTYPTAIYGWASKVITNGFIYTYNGIEWKNTGITIFPINIAEKNDILLLNNKISNKETILDDNNALISYVGTGWSHVSDNPLDYNGTNSATSVTNDYFELDFYGDKLELYSRVATSKGIVEILIDGVSKGTIDCYSSTLIYQKLIYSISSLTTDFHTLKVVTTGTKNPASTGIGFTFDYIKTTNSKYVDNKYISAISKFVSNRETILDNTNILFNYAGLGWSHVSDNPLDYNGTSSQTSTTGDYLTLDFYGDEINLYARKTPSRGIVEIFIDGISKGTVDCYNSVVKYQNLIYSISGLSLDYHVLKIVTTGTKNPASTGIGFIFDYIKTVNSNNNIEILNNTLYPQISSKNNANQPLFIETYDGGNQGLHPKTLYFANGWNGYKYWFVFSPYKNQNDDLENPCIYCSNDGINFTVPIGLNNPLDIPINLTTSYNSDPHLVYNSVTNKIECWWRRVEDPTWDEVIYRRTSSDGINWSEKEQCFTIHTTSSVVGSTRAAISPSIIFDGTKYKMWASNTFADDGSGRVISYYESTNGTTFTKIRDLSFSGFNPSHLDVIFSSGKYRLVFFDVNSNGYPYFYAESPDNITYTTPFRILNKGISGSWDSQMLYRPSLCVVNGWYRLYYSAYSDYGTNYVGLIIFDDFDRLKIV